MQMDPNCLSISASNNSRSSMQSGTFAEPGHRSW
jgi:hypothetical protein